MYLFVQAPRRLVLVFLKFVHYILFICLLDGSYSGIVKEGKGDLFYAPIPFNLFVWLDYSDKNFNP